jgi:hypothetical protein
VVFIGAGGAGLTLTLSHHSTWGARPPCPTPVLGKVANGELLAGHDSPGFFHHERVWVALGFRFWVCCGQVGGGSEAGRQKASLPLLHVQRKKNKNNIT